MKFCFDEKIYPEARVRPALVHSRRCYSSLGAETDLTLARVMAYSAPPVHLLYIVYVRL